MLDPDSSPDVKLQPPQSGRRSRSTTWRILLNVVWFLTLLAGALTIGGLFARYSFVLELFCHFRMQYAIALLCAMAAFAIARRGCRAATAAVLAAINLMVIVPLYVTRSSDQATEDGPQHQLRILSANVLSSNSRYDALLKLVEQENPDVIVLSEITPRWIDQIAQVKKDYPHFREVPSADNFGIALYSKVPLEAVEVLRLGQAEVPSIVAGITIGSQHITINAVHVLPPSSQAYWVDRNRALAELAAKIQAQQQPVVVVGDLNTTSWSPAFSDFVTATDLVDSRQGFGVHATFPSDRLIVRIPIDHCLISPALTVTDRRVGPDIGSDHLPIVIDLEVGGDPEQTPR